MPRTAALLAVAALAAPAAAQEYTPIKLTVSPAAAPSPGLKYRLLPDPRTLTPGNAATLYQRTLAMFVENQNLLADLKAGPWDDWRSLPLEEWPKGDVAPRLRTTKYVLRELELAARCKECDWQLGGRSEGVALLLPDIQGYRVVARPVAVQARHQIALGDFEGAAHTLQTGLGLGRHMTQSSLLIQTLVGIAIDAIMLGQVDAWVGAPNSPNLYWALSALPRPSADLFPTIVEDVASVERSFPSLKLLEGPPMTPAQVQQVQDEYRKFFVDITGRPPNWGQWLTQSLMISGMAKEAREGLLKHGVPAERIDKLPPFQLAGLYALREYQRESEELLKWYHLPESLTHPAYKEASDRQAKALRRLDMLFSRGLLTALSDGELGQLVLKVYAAVTRTDRKIAALRCVEALRMHAAAHGGKLPAKLAEVTAVPVPDDPATGKPFVYELKGETAVLDGPPPAGQERNRANAITYEITVRK
jgi:hypothetical protein